MMHWRFPALDRPGFLMAAALWAAPAAADRDCVQFGAKPLRAGSSFNYPLASGLEFRLSDMRGGWSIEVGPQADREADFLAPVSPPFRSAPHRVIGAAYGVTAHESVRVSPRQLRFVLNRRDAQAARDIGSAALLGDVQRLKELDQLAKGTVTLRIAAADADDEVVRWIAFDGEACLPR